MISPAFCRTWNLIRISKWEIFVIISKLWVRWAANKTFFFSAINGTFITDIAESCVTLRLSSEVTRDTTYASYKINYFSCLSRTRFIHNLHFTFHMAFHATLTVFVEVTTNKFQAFLFFFSCRYQITSR